MIQQKMQFCSISFNPRSYKRSDYFQRYMQKTLERFQSTLLQEERLNYVILRLLTLHFQSTLLQEERLLDCVPVVFIQFSFNPRSYKRSDPTGQPRLNPVCLSIHAPTRGATNSTFARKIKKFIFQSTLLQEERQFGGTYYLRF